MTGITEILPHSVKSLLKVYEVDRGSTDTEGAFFIRMQNLKICLTVLLPDLLLTVLLLLHSLAVEVLYYFQYVFAWLKMFMVL